MQRTINVNSFILHCNKIGSAPPPSPPRQLITSFLQDASSHLHYCNRNPIILGMKQTEVGHQRLN